MTESSCAPSIMFSVPERYGPMSLTLKRAVKDPNMSVKRKVASQYLNGRGFIRNIIFRFRSIRAHLSEIEDESISVRHGDNPRSQAIMAQYSPWLAARRGTNGALYHRFDWLTCLSKTQKIPSKTKPFSIISDVSLPRSWKRHTQPPLHWLASLVVTLPRGGVLPRLRLRLQLDSPSHRFKFFPVLVFLCGLLTWIRGRNHLMPVLPWEKIENKKRDHLWVRTSDRFVQLVTNEWLVEWANGNAISFGSWTAPEFLSLSATDPE